MAPAARAAAATRTGRGTGWPAPAVARPLQLGDVRGQRFHPLGRQRPRPRPVLARIQRQQLADLLQREARGLRVADEPQPPYLVRPVPPDRAVARRRREKSPALVEADRLDAHAASGRKATDGQRLPLLTLYHGTDPICAPTRSLGGDDVGYVSTSRTRQTRHPLPDGHAGARLPVGPEGAGPAEAARLRDRRPPPHQP